MEKDPYQQEESEQDVTARENGFINISINDKNYLLPSRTLWGDQLSLLIMGRIFMVDPDKFCIYTEAQNPAFTTSCNLADFYLAYRKSRDHYNVLTLKESGVLPDGVLPPTRKIVTRRPTGGNKTGKNKTRKHLHRNKTGGNKTRKHLRGNKTGGDIQKEGENQILHLLFIRHCEGCHNIKKRILPGVAKVPLFNIAREPLCTKNGVVQSYTYGREMPELLTEYKKNKYLPENINEIVFGSSFLARAVETIFMVARGFDNEKDKKGFYSSEFPTQTKIIDHISELTNKFEDVTSVSSGSTNVTNYEKIKGHCEFFNKSLNGDSNVSVDYSKIIGDRYEGQEVSDRERIYKNTKESYEKLISDVIPKLYQDYQQDSNSKLFAFVTHGYFMKKYFLDDEKLSNLSSALVRFEIDSNGKVVKHTNLSFQKKNHGI